MYLGKKKKNKIWWLPGYYFNPPEKRPGELNNYSFGNFSVTMCPGCKTAWEYGLVGKRRTPVYYTDFPIYKLKEVKCPKCEESDETD